MNIKLGKFCLTCGDRIDDVRLLKNPDQQFCSIRCVANYPPHKAKRIAATAKANRQRWEQWRAAGIDPAHGGQAAKKRGKKIAASNRQKPRRQRTTQPT